MGRQSITLGLLVCVTLLYNTRHVVAINATLLPLELILNVSGSPTSTYDGNNYSPSNVFDRNPSTLPDVCDCCWSTYFPYYPSLWVGLTTAVTIDRIVVKGASDADMLRGLQVYANGFPLRMGNTEDIRVTVRVAIANVTSLQFKHDVHPFVSFGGFTICELEIYVVAFRVSRDLVSSITSSPVLSNNSTNYSAGNVFDQNSGTLPETCDCCWSSRDEYDPWLLVVLKAPLIVHVIHVKGRSDLIGTGDNLDGLSVKVNNMTLRRGRLSHVSSDVHVRPGTMAVKSLTFSRYITSGYSGQWFLTICELEIYWIACRPGEYGVDCTNTCGHCMGGTTDCDRSNGHCTFGCSSGYKRTPLCNTACDPGYYGKDCSETCGHCTSHDVCNKETGTCPTGCAAGYTGTLCKQECPEGTYTDIGCTKCGSCRDGAVCNKVNGTCPGGCSCGYIGSTCNTTCPSNTFGEHCSHTCHCATGSVCNKCTGHCSLGCALGWLGNNCSTDANILSHIQESVEVSMSGMYSCNNASLAINGLHGPPFDTCTTCSITSNNTQPWWQLNLGAQYLIADIEIFGETDDGNKSRSLNVSMYVGNVTIQSEFKHGTLIQHTEDPDDMKLVAHLDPAMVLQYIEIMRSIPSYLTICEVRVFERVCGHGIFGANCSSTCHCKDDHNCDNVNGSCPHGVCAPGWTGVTCSDMCDHTTFGANCMSECHCKDGGACDPLIGTCPGCSPGWTGSTCSTECPHGYFGANCQQQCHCIQKSSCNNVNGTCERAQCDPGWMEMNCSVESPKGTYGPNCSDTFSCDEVIKRCDIGSNNHIKEKAVQAKEDGAWNYGPVIGGLVAANVVLILAGVAINILIVRRNCGCIKRKYEVNAYAKMNVSGPTPAGEEYDSIPSVDQGIHLNIAQEPSFVNDTPK